MAEMTIDIVYGNALFQVAQDVSKTEAILHEGKEVLNLFKREPEFLEFFKNPTIPVKEKKEIIKTVLGEQICEELLNLLYVLIDKGRSRHYEEILKVYKKLLDKEEGLSYGKVLSAKALNEEQIEKIQEKTSKLLDEKVKLENQIDTSLIGGIKILIEGKIIDASVKKRLDDLGSFIK